MFKDKSLIAVIALIIIIVLIAFLAVPALIMLLWNWLAVAIFGLPKITFWMAFGISILMNLLFGKIVYTKQS